MNASEMSNGVSVIVPTAERKRVVYVVQWKFDGSWVDSRESPDGTLDLAMETKKSDERLFPKNEHRIIKRTEEVVG